MNAPDLFNPLEGLQLAGQRLFDLWKQVEAFLSGPEGVRWFVLLLGLWTFGELTTRLMRRGRERQRRLRAEEAHRQALDLMSRAMLGYRVAIFVQTFTLGEAFRFVFELEGEGIVARCEGVYPDPLIAVSIAAEAFHRDLDAAARARRSSSSRRRRQGRHRPGQEQREDTGCWAVLGLRRGASLSDVKEAYARLARKHHPDRGGSTSMMASINNARDEAIKELSAGAA